MRFIKRLRASSLLFINLINLFINLYKPLFINLYKPLSSIVSY